MMLRTAIMVAAALALTAAVFGALVDPGVWPAACVALLVLVGTWFERRRYGALERAPQGDGWHPTTERFVDDASGSLVTVWYNTRTGERRYVGASLAEREEHLRGA
jgi:hypothetical protein